MRIALAIATCLLAALPARAQPVGVGSRLESLSAAEAASRRMHPAVARIVAPSDGSVSYGSGTLVHIAGEYGLVVTNWHVVNEATGAISVHFPDGFYSLGTIQNVDRDWDLAVIAIRRPSVEPVRISDRPPQPGEMLTIAGYGSGQYREASGPCTQYVAPGLQFPYEMVEVAVSARQGDSGGPIFNSRGELAGVLFGEGNGRTSGSYCGRVRWFLTSIVPPPAAIASRPALAQQPLEAIPARPPDRQAPGEASDQESPQARGPLPVVATSSMAAPPPSAAAPVATTSTLTSTVTRGEPTPPVAAVATAEALAPPVASTSAGPEVIYLGWQDIAGETLADQAKTVLAAVGALAMVLQILRWLGREAPAAK